ncbi:flagellar hook-length control protein FliK [Pseudovibrio brasiliensis]|uniref:Flagellar hook-length control protein FliK n=1 Tax=Pseudovibrio brasiliensis TaxID=1898042 RepID=A0ABX8AQR3_9HYPH|nr:flagellar hook-length control protein FliK [Pseudovibrio brasiliensis]QUS57442.1 flagellar hook-length control protein FliK [Pseudovibrio brasiliensis]
MNTTLPNIDRSAPVKDASEARKDAARNDNDNGKDRFDKVIDKVRDDRKVPERRNPADDRKANAADEKSASTGSEETEASDALKQLIKKASSNTAGENTAQMPDGAKDAGVSGENLPDPTEELAAKQLVANAIMTAEQKAGLQMSAVTGLVNARGAASADKTSAMAQVLNALGTRDQKALNGDVQTSASKSDTEAVKQGATANSDIKSGIPSAKLDSSGAINLPKNDGLTVGNKQTPAEFLLKQGMPQPEASVNQNAGKAAGGEVKVVSVETHLPPADMGRPVHQVASVLTKQLPAAASAAKAAQEVLAQIAEAQAAKPMKALEIQLRPDNLGVVRANIQMRGGELEISLITSTQEAADMLKGDRQALARVLQDAGYRTETQNITVNFKDEMSDQMRQPGQNQERFGRGNNSDSEAGEGGSQQNWDEQPQAEFAGTGQNEPNTQDLRSGIYL